MKKIFILLFFGMLFPNISEAQITVTEKGQPVSRIVLSIDNSIDMKAAKLLQDFIQKISGAKLPIVSQNTLIRDNDILIGNQGLDTKKIKEDGFRISTIDNKIYIVSGGGYGSVYGIVTLLEKYLGVGYWGEYEYSFEPNESIVIPYIDIIENPAFRYRQSQNYALTTDSIYKLWNRLKSPEEVFAANYWVHTFDRLLPSAVYGEEHPEYYSFFKDKRHPG